MWSTSWECRGTKKKDPKVVERHDTFVNRIRACVSATANPVVKAVLAFLESDEIEKGNRSGRPCAVKGPRVKETEKVNQSDELNSLNNVFNDIPFLLPQGGYGGQDSCRKTGAIFALIAKAPLSPQDCSPQSSLGAIIGRLHPWHKGKGEQRRPELQEIAGHSLRFGIAARAP